APRRNVFIASRSAKSAFLRGAKDDNGLSMPLRPMVTRRSTRHNRWCYPLAAGAGLALDPELAPVPEDVPGSEAAQRACAEAGVEDGPGAEPLGGRLAGVGQAVRLFGGERLSHVLIRHLPPPKSCVVGVGRRRRSRDAVRRGQRQLSLANCPRA